MTSIPRQTVGSVGKQCIKKSIRVIFKYITCFDRIIRKIVFVYI